MRETHDYFHEQPGIGMLLTIAFAAGCMLIVTLRSGMRIPALIFFALFIFLAVCFYKLSVTVTAAEIRVRFGAGFIKFSYPLSEVESADRIKLPPFPIWGIRSIGKRRGWSFTVWGWDAVELRMRNETRLRIGTDDPAGLLAAIRERL